MPELNQRQQAFVEEFLRNGGNATAAYSLAYGCKDNSPSVQQRAWKLKRHPAVMERLEQARSASVAAIEAAVTRYEITAERVADELARLAFTRMSQIADVVHEVDQHGKQRLAVRVKPFSECDQDALAAIVEVKRTVGGEVSVKLADKRAALMDIARLKGWIADKPVDNKQLVMLKIER